MRTHGISSIFYRYAAPLRVAARLPTGPMERDERDPALWDHQTALAWLAATASKAPDADAGADANAGADADADATALLGVSGAFLPNAAVEGPFDAEAVMPGMSGLEACFDTHPVRVQDSAVITQRRRAGYWGEDMRCAPATMGSS